jgi:hypothetical protein
MKGIADSYFLAYEPAPPIPVSFVTEIYKTALLIWTDSRNVEKTKERTEHECQAQRNEAGRRRPTSDITYSRSEHIERERGEFAQSLDDSLD